MKINSYEVHGVAVDERTRCKHYHSDLDIIAIRFKCCGKYFPCISCHQEIEDHSPEKWGKEDFDERAILCGNCCKELTIAEYLKCESFCPHCRAPFNPGCVSHWDLYFNL